MSIAEHNRTAVEQAFIANQTALIGWLAKSVGERDLAREIAQKTFLRVWRFSEKNTVEKPKSLIFQTAARLVMDECRKRNKYYSDHEFIDDGGFGRELSDIRFREQSPEEITAGKQEVALVFAAIQRLPVNVRTAFLMHRFDGLNYQEIADRMRLSKSSIEKYMIVALKRIRESVRRGNEIS
jgi:RNA polymerase sigma-70 factor (ECF subfamily)